MATILNKNLVRETTLKVKDRELIISLMSNQSVELKLKGVRKGDVLSIPILELYEYLGGVVGDNSKQKAVIKKSKANEGMINLYDLRSMNMITEMDLKMKSEFDKIISEVIKESK